MSAPAPAPPSSGIPILPPPPQTSGPGRSHPSSHAEATLGPNSTSNALCLLDEELLCLGVSWRGQQSKKACGIGRRAEGWLCT